MLEGILELKPSLIPDGSCSAFPRLLYIEPTNHCGARCYMCPSRVGFREKGFMDLNLFKKIIDDVASARQYRASSFRSKFVIYLQGQGSPLISKDLFEMIEYSKRRKFRTGFSTNALMLNKENSEKLIKSGLDVLEFSVYALDREKYASIHGVDQMELAFKNMIRFLHLSKGSGIRMPANILMSDRTLSESEFLNYMYSSLPFSEPRNILIRDFHGLFAQLGLTKEIDFLSPSVVAPGKILMGCHKHVMSIHWDGDISPCPSMYEKRFIVGNAGRENVFKIWNNERYKAFRIAAIRNDYSGIGYDFCNKCSYGNRSLYDRKVLLIRGRGSRANYQFIMDNFPLNEEDNWIKNLENLRNAFEHRS